MPNPVSTSDLPKLVEPKPRRVYIKDGKRKMTSDTGWMRMPASLARRAFGRYKGGRYSHLQDA